MARSQESLEELVHKVADRASALTGVAAAEIERELEPNALPEGGWLVRFTGPSLQVREAVAQAIAEMKP